MKKIPTIFKRDPVHPRWVTDEVTPGCEWVLAGEGLATRKFNGTCVMYDEQGLWWARREVRPKSPVPACFREVERDLITGKRVGWEPIEQSPFVKYLREAANEGTFTPGTYELIGPRVNQNPEKVEKHTLILHGTHPILIEGGEPSNYEEMEVLLKSLAPWEGIVWYRLNGDKAKLKLRDLR